ncbi:hypothetical protein DGG96_16110 [Legionella qingyii]|uniref:Uncharacterized protein n=1 Tax=Legionella qingyii TaxID=2184757 RepID=A0A317TZ11_9GAMM|nr:hypothetical protein DGG96_18475 [Legionella qingyii]PWY54533.1 hypothetical protein DGG96_16110 [Legionella qingyii]
MQIALIALREAQLTVATRVAKVPDFVGIDAAKKVVVTPRTFLEIKERLLISPTDQKMLLKDGLSQVRD